MCGIVAAVAERQVGPILVEGLSRLEYRGYDSAGLALIDENGVLCSVRSVGKVAALNDKVEATPLGGQLGIAHTRWATHGVPVERNAHLHIAPGAEHGLAVVAVAHDQFKALGASGIRRRLQPEGVIYDIKQILPRPESDGRL